MDIGYFLAFITGLTGGFGHCMGMCGPLVASYSLNLNAIDRTSAYSRYAPHILYNAGRLTTYVFIGSLMGLTGSFVNTAAGFAGVQNVVAIGTGFFMILMGLNITGVLKGMNYIEMHNSAILKAVGVVLEGPSAWRYYPLGLVLGFLPCGLSYSMFIAAAGTGSFFSGMFLTFCFGAGTVPALMLFGVMIGSLSSRARTWVYRTGGIIVIIMGIYFIYKGVCFRR